MPLEIANTVLASAPYFDDYDETKNYHRILFRPAVAVQARELTQLQTILQEQIERFGNHVFKDGSIVQGCSVEYITDLEYIGIEDQFSDDSDLSLADPTLKGAIAVGQTSDVQALLIDTQSGFIRQKPGRFFLRYTKPGANSRTFIPGEEIRLYGETQSYVEDIVLSVVSANVFANTIGLSVDGILGGTVTARAIIVSVDANNNTITVNNIRRRFSANDNLVLHSNAAVSSTITDVNYDLSTEIGRINVLSPVTDGIAIANTDIVGFAYGAHVSDGIIYHKGNFIRVDAHNVIVNPANSSPAGYLLGFVTDEEVITETSDETLYDNALGYSNQNAPGAHRLRLTSTVVARQSNAISNTEIFFPIVEFSNTGVAYDRTDPQYAALGDEIAKRTYEESGHYIIKPFGLSSTIDPSNSNNVIYEVTPGLAYVKGYRNELLTNLPVIGRRGTNTASYSDQIVTMSYGNYIEVKELRGYFPTDQLATVQLLDTVQQAVTTSKTSISAHTGASLGTANIRELVLVSGEKGAANAVYRAYLTNIQLASNTANFASVKSIFASNGGANSFADVPDATVKESTYAPLVFSVGASAVKTLKDANNVSENQYYYTAANTTVSLDISGHVTFRVPAGGGILGFSDGSDFSEQHIDLILGANTTTANLISTANVSANGLITGTDIGNLFYPGEAVIHGGNTYNVTAVINTNAIQTSASAASTNQTLKRMHFGGSVVALDGVHRSVNIDANNQATISLGSAIENAPIAADVRFYTLQNQAIEIKKEIRRGTSVVVQVANTGTDTGPWTLGIPDGIKLQGVYVSTGANSALATADFNSNLANKFKFDNGQTDGFYDHCFLSMLSKADANTYAGQKLVVVFDHFIANTSAGKGFFSVDSYPIDDSTGYDANTKMRTYEIPSFYSSSQSKTFDLRDSIDFRPYKAATATVTDDIRQATIAPSYTTTFNANTTAYKPYPGQNFELNYTHYLGRKDVMTITPAGVFEIVEGVSSLTPRTPTIDTDSLSIANINVPPYPSLSDLEKRVVTQPNYAITISVQSHQRFTMSDIAGLKQRIERLEYYTTLNTLQIAAANTAVVSADGSDRFKNGIFVEPFSDHSFGRVDDIHYRIAIDETNGFARPFFQPDYFEMEYDSTQSVGITQVGDHLLMSFGEVPFLTQAFATESRTLSGAPPSFIGSMLLKPAVWTEIETLQGPATIIATDAPASALASMTNAQLCALYGWWRVDANGAVSSSNTGLANNATVSVRDSTTTSSSTAASIQSYIRPREVAFSASGLKPYTTFKIYIDDFDVSQFSAPGDLANTAAPDDGYVTRTELWGSDLTSDSRGNLIGKIAIPGDRFKVGAHTVKLLSEAIDVVTNAQVSSAAALFSVNVNYQTAPGPVVVISIPPPPVPPPPPAPPPATVPPAPPAPTGPTAKFAWAGQTYVTAPANHSIEFNGGYSTAGSSPIVSWAWTFGDGTSYNGVYPGVRTFGASLTTQSTNPYTVTLTVTDSNGLKSTYSEVITLYKLPPPPTASINITCYSNQTVIGTGTIGGVYEANINMIASASTTYPGAYYRWAVNVISGNTLNAIDIGGAANNTCIPHLVDTNPAAHANNLYSSFTVGLDYVASNGFLIAHTGLTFSLWTIAKATSPTPNVAYPSNTQPVSSGSGSGGGCVTSDSMLNISTSAKDVTVGFLADTWTPADDAMISSYAAVQVHAPKFSECVELVTESDIRLRCSVTTPFNLITAEADLEEGQWKFSPDMLGELVMVDDNGVIGWEEVVEVNPIGLQEIVPLGFDGRSFAAGVTGSRRIFSHNMMKPASKGADGSYYN